MFSSSTQLNHWIFSSLEEIFEKRKQANQAFIDSFAVKIEIDSTLSFKEESLILNYYQNYLYEFCSTFKPPMPKYVIGTSIAYFKRLYLNTSVMECHPKEFLYTCAYLACKVEEFNLSIGQFVANIDVKNDQIINTLLSTELQLMLKLNYHLTVHNPYRPIEGFLIDIKARCPEIPNAEQLRPNFDKFLDKVLLTDASLLFSPSQIALASLVTSAASFGFNASMDRYIANKLFESANHTVQQKILKQIKKIRLMVQKMVIVPWSSVADISEKLDVIHSAYVSLLPQARTGDVFVKEEVLDLEVPEVKKIKIEENV